MLILISVHILKNKNGNVLIWNLGNNFEFPFSHSDSIIFIKPWSKKGEEYVKTKVVLKKRRKSWNNDLYKLKYCDLNFIDERFIINRKEKK